MSNNKKEIYPQMRRSALLLELYDLPARREEPNQERQTIFN